MTKEKITTVFVTDTTLEIKNVVEPVSTKQLTSKIFKSEMNAYRHDNDMKNAVLVWKDRDETKPTNCDEEISYALKKNNDGVRYSVSRYVQTPVTTIREVKIWVLKNIKNVVSENKININVNIMFFDFPNLVIATIVIIASPSVNGVIINRLLKTWFEK